MMDGSAPPGPDRHPLFAPGFKTESYWAEGLPSAPACDPDPPNRADVVVIGSGYTGLNAALELARGGRGTVVLEAGDPGSGCSTRNGGQVHASVMPGATRLLDRLGPRKTYTILSEGPASVDWLDHLIGREEIACDFARSGSFHAAHTPWHFDMLAREVENGSDPGAKPAILVTPQNLHTEIGSAQYFGGVVHPKDGALHPGKYHRGLLDRVISAGATMIAGCAALRLSRDGEDFEVETTRGRVRCRDVAIATNGYTTSLTPWLK